MSKLAPEWRKIEFPVRYSRLSDTYSSSPSSSVPFFFHRLLFVFLVLVFHLFSYVRATLSEGLSVLQSVRPSVHHARVEWKREKRAFMMLQLLLCYSSSHIIYTLGGEDDRRWGWTGAKRGGRMSTVEGSRPAKIHFQVVRQSTLMTICLRGVAERPTEQGVDIVQSLLISPPL